jgi:hypothetical protein
MSPKGNVIIYSSLVICFLIWVVFPTLGESDVTISIGRSSKFSIGDSSIVLNNGGSSGNPYFSLIFFNCLII